MGRRRVISCSSSSLESSPSRSCSISRTTRNRRNWRSWARQMSLRLSMSPAMKRRPMGEKVRPRLGVSTKSSISAAFTVVSTVSKGTWVWAATWNRSQLPPWVSRNSSRPRISGLAAWGRGSMTSGTLLGMGAVTSTSGSSAEVMMSCTRSTSFRNSGVRLLRGRGSVLAMMVRM